MKLISPKELSEKLRNKEDIQLIDIRETYEFEDGTIGNLNIPLDEMMTSIAKISKSKEVVVYCNSGNRSAAIIYMLEKKYNYKNLLNLEGGYTAYLEL